MDFDWGIFFIPFKFLFYFKFCEKMKSKKFDEYSFTLKEIDESKRKAIMVSPEIGKKIKANFFLKIGKEKIENENRGKFEIRRRNENQRTSRSRRIKIFTQDSSVSSRNQSLDRRELSWLKDPLLLKKRSVKKIQRIFMQEKVMFKKLPRIG